MSPREQEDAAALDYLDSTYERVVIQQGMAGRMVVSALVDMFSKVSGNSIALLDSSDSRRAGNEAPLCTAAHKLHA